MSRKTETTSSIAQNQNDVDSCMNFLSEEALVKRVNRQTLKDFLAKKPGHNQQLRAAKSLQTHPWILAHLAGHYSKEYNYSRIEDDILNNALRNPSLPIDSIAKFLSLIEKDYYENYGKYYALLDNPSIPRELLVKYVGTESLEVGIYTDKISNLMAAKIHQVLKHPSCPDYLIEENLNDMEALHFIARNKAITNRLAIMIAEKDGPCADLERVTQFNIFTILVKNPAVSQEVIQSLIPDEKGIWRDGLPTPIKFIRTLALNLRAGTHRELCFKLLTQMSKDSQNLGLVAYLSENQETLVRIVDRASSSVAKVAAKRTLDPESSLVVVALRTNGEAPGKVPSKPRNRNA